MDFHSLRHTFCTNLHRAGVPQREAMELMRHNDPRLTANTYADASLFSLRSAVEKLPWNGLEMTHKETHKEMTLGVICRHWLSQWKIGWKVENRL